MQYSITITEEDYQVLTSHLFVDRLKERAAYLLCRFSITQYETRLLITEVILVTEKEILESTETSMSIKSYSYVRAIKKARLSKQGFIFVHSHPSGHIEHSRQDDIEESKLFKSAYERIKQPIHASMVISDVEKPIARVWHIDGTFSNVNLIRVIGKKFSFYSHGQEPEPFPEFFDRQIRAFGDDIQRTLQKLKIGIVGAGGTGSAIAEQLIRLGVGEIHIFDGQQFELSNINRVYGSNTTDKKRNKVEIIERLAHEIGIGTKIKPFDKPITYASISKELRNCDVIFGCTDDELGRSILCRIATYYIIPIFDMGVKVNSNEGIILSIDGRVTTLLPNVACLFCRDRIGTAMIESESLEIVDPEMAMAKRKNGYIPELPNTAPAVIPFTTAIASMAITEFLHRLTGFLGMERVTNEVIYLFDRSEIKRNYRLSKEDCFCGDKDIIGRGDTSHFLDLTWREEYEI